MSAGPNQATGAEPCSTGELESVGNLVAGASDLNRGQ
jgi:hypothetical protein